MKFILAMMMALAVSFSSVAFAAAPSDLQFTQRDCVNMGEIAYMISLAKSQGVPSAEIIETIISSNGEPTDEQIAAFTEFVEGVYSEELQPEVVGAAVIQSCLAEISG